MVSEAVDSLLALTLVEPTVQCADHKTFRSEELRHTLHSIAIVEKHDRLLVAELEEHLQQRLQFVLLWRLHREETDAVGRLLVAVEEVDTLRSTHAHEARHLLGVGSREQHASIHVRQTLHCGTKAHAQTLVELVEHEPVYVVDCEVLLCDMVVESARRSKHYLRTESHHLAVLVHRSTSAVERYRAQTGAHAAKHLARLQCEFATRHDDYRLHLVELSVETRGYG